MSGARHVTASTNTVRDSPAAEASGCVVSPVWQEGERRRKEKEEIEIEKNNSRDQVKSLEWTAVIPKPPSEEQNDYFQRAVQRAYFQTEKKEEKTGIGGPEARTEVRGATDTGSAVRRRGGQIIPGKQDQCKVSDFKRLPDE